MFKSLGVPELLLIIFIIFLIFGVGKLPQVGAQFGKAIRSFKKAQSEDSEDEKSEIKTEKISASKVMDSNDKSK